MIPARKFPLGQRLVEWLIDSSLRKGFDSIFFRVSHEITDEQRSLPMIVCANHSSWWDGYIAALVARLLSIDAYLMMEEPQLRRYFFFAWAGCFSVDRHNPRSAMQSLHYAAHLLKGHPGRTIWLFPQGEIVPNDRRPLVFYSGAAHLAHMVAPALLFPLASRIEYLNEQRPNLFISLGAPVRIDAEKTPGSLKTCTQRLEACVTTELDQVRADVLACDFTRFTQIMQGRPSTNRIFDSLLFRKQMSRQ